MIVTERSGRKISVRRRDPDTLERIEDTLEAYPYFFVEAGQHVPGAVRYEGDYEGVFGTVLQKVFFRTEYERRDATRGYPTWEKTVPFVNQVLNDRLLRGNEPFPNYRHRIWYLDGEWKAESEEITMLSVWDNYTERMFTWVQHPEVEPGMVRSMPCKDHPEGLTEVTFDTPAMAFKDEKSLLQHFVQHMAKHDPDIITGWYVVDADISTISHRMRRLGLDPKAMSPYRQHTWKYSVTDKKWTQPIPGRLCIDLMVAFKKLWTIKNGQLAGQKLDDVAELVLGERKVELKDGHDTYYSDIGTYTDYNRQDVRLLPRLDEALNVINYYTSLQHLIQCNMQTTPMVTACATSLFIQDPDFTRRIPDRPQHSKVDYQGADVQEPEPGIYNNMAIMDIKAMYHSNVNLHNISWDTLDASGKDCGNGVCFSQDTRGLLGRTMDKLTVQRNEYKRKMREDPDNSAKWDAMQFATKSMVASLYGVCGDSKYGMYHPDIASAITFTSRQTLFRLRDECNDRGYPVRYGHTDSIFCEVPSPEEGLRLLADINKSMAPIETEFEKWCESMILKAKNRYAGKVVWTDGEYHEPDYYYKGLELKQTRMPKAMKTTMDQVLRNILDGTSKDDTDAMLTDLIERGKSGELGNDLLPKGKLSQPLHAYKSVAGAAAGAAWASRALGREYQPGESFLYAIDMHGDFIAFDSVEDIRDIAHVDWPEMTMRFIVKKATDLYDLVGWSPQELVNAHRGLGLLQWL